MLNNSAYQKPSTENPSMSEDDNKIIIALITRRKSPNVIMVSGIVNITKIGLTNTLRRDIITAANNAVMNESTATPGRI